MLAANRSFVGPEYLAKLRRVTRSVHEFGIIALYIFPFSAPGSRAGALQAITGNERSCYAIVWRAASAGVTSGGGAERRKPIVTPTRPNHLRFCGQAIHVPSSFSRYSLTAHRDRDEPVISTVRSSCPPTPAADTHAQREREREVLAEFSRTTNRPYAKPSSNCYNSQRVSPRGTRAAFHADVSRTCVLYE